MVAALFGSVNVDVSCGDTDWRERTFLRRELSTNGDALAEGRRPAVERAVFLSLHLVDVGFRVARGGACLVRECTHGCRDDEL